MGENDKTTVLKGGGETVQMDEKSQAADAALIIVRGEPQGKRYVLNQASMIIGRDPTMSLAVNDTNVSRKHAEVCTRDGKVFIKDLGSTNGTFLNDKKLEKETELQKEDMIKVGGTILKFLPPGAIENFVLGKLEDKAHKDSLTGAFNKGYIMEALDTEFKRAKALHQEFCLIILDLDHFKKINDTFGHDAGDMVLKVGSQMVATKILPKGALFGRFGGEEFMIILPNTGIDPATELAEKLRSTLEKTNFMYGDKRIPVTASIGVAEMGLDVDNSAALFKLADKAVYAAKNGGRNQVQVGR